MKINETIGLDMSKLTMDVTVHHSKAYSKFENSKEGFKQMIKWAYKKSDIRKDEILFIFEHTGLYSYQLSVFLTAHDIPFALVPGLAIKRSLGIVRGKNDKVDSKMIALYGYRLRDELIPTVIPDRKITEIKALMKLRERIVIQRAGYKSSLKEYSRVIVKKENSTLLDTQQTLIRALTKQVDKLDNEIQTRIISDEKLKKIFDLIVSIKGIGTQMALVMIVTTNGFTKFKNSRKYASYCGIAPFPNQSGTSLRGKSKVSKLAVKKIKTLLDLCARSAIQHNPEMRTYYNKRIELGKNPKSTRNIIRNKLLSRIFAVVNRGTAYVDINRYAA